MYILNFAFIYSYLYTYFQFDVDGNDDDGACGESSILHETFVPFGNDTQLPEDDLSLSHPLAAAFVGDNLVAQPRKVCFF